VTRAAKRISTGGRAHPLKRCLRYFGALTVARDQPAPKPRISVWSCRRDQQPRAEYAVAGWSVGARRRVGSAAVLPAPRAPGSGRTAPAKAPRRAARSTSGRTRAFDREERSPRPQPDASPGHKTQPRGIRPNRHASIGIALVTARPSSSSDPIHGERPPMTVAGTAVVSARRLVLRLRASGPPSASRPPSLPYGQYCREQLALPLELGNDESLHALAQLHELRHRIFDRGLELIDPGISGCGVDAGLGTCGLPEHEFHARLRSEGVHRGQPGQQRYGLGPLLPVVPAAPGHRAAGLKLAERLDQALHRGAGALARLFQQPARLALELLSTGTWFK
jgi:hypothetical protein